MAVKRYDGSAWQVVAGKGDQGTSSSIATWVKTASGGETSLSGNDDNSQALSYTVGQELVFINGTLLKRDSDYTATNGTSITGLTALAANDVATVWTVNAFSVTNAISSGLVTTTGDIIYASGANTPARLGIGSTGNVLTVSGGVPAWSAPAAPAFNGAQVKKSVAQSTGAGGVTTITFDQENYDTNSYHDNVTNNSRLTVPTTGYYRFTINTGMGNYPVGVNEFVQIRLYKNGSQVQASLTQYIASFDAQATAGDYFEFLYYNDLAQSLNSTFSVQFLGA